MPLKSDVQDSFTIKKALPLQCQFGPIYGMVTGDYNNDGHPDILITGNSYSTEVSTGNYDAMSGLLMAGDGKGNFKPLNAATTGFLANGDSKGMAEINIANGSSEILVANNNDTLQSYLVMNKATQTIHIKQNDVYAIIHETNGKSFKKEFYFGSTYLSSSSRAFNFGQAISGLAIYNNKGEKREVAVHSK